jgi:AcrR family transcriptional regulator
MPAAAPTSAATAPPQRRRAVVAQDRRRQILDAALDIFAEHGYAAARLDDVAARAGVAKGTIYLHFADKRSLFMDLVRGAAAPMIERIGELAVADAPIDQLLRVLAERFQTEVLGTRRKEVFRLVIAEAGRFPELAEFYHRDIISRILPLLREALARAARRGELRVGVEQALPHLFIAPFFMSIIWDGLFGSIEPLDTRALLSAHIDLLTGKGATKS